MVSRALANDTGFGVVYLASGSEFVEKDDEPIELAKIGTLSSVKHTEVIDETRILIVVEGGAKFRVHSTWTEDDHLHMGLVEFLRDDAKLPLRTKDGELVQIFDQLNEVRITEGHPKVKLQRDNASALSFRLAEMLPMAMQFRQTLLELDHPYRRLDRIQRWVEAESKRD